MSDTSYLTDYSGHASDSIIVTNNQELQSALAQLDQGSGGTILLDGDGGPFTVRAHGIGGSDSPILIKSLDDSNPPTLHNVSIFDSSHIAITGTVIDSSGAGSSGDLFDVRVTQSEHIQIVGNTMTGEADGYLSSTTNATQAENGGLVRDSSDVTIAGNDISNYFFAFNFLDSTDIEYSGNHITGLQADAFSGAGVQNVVIADNTMEGFYGSDQSENHSDFIQIFGQGATLLNSNIEISGNLMSTAGAPSYQGILIGGAGSENFQDISIHDNVIYTGSPHGIYVAGVDGLEIQDNTVLWNPDNWTKMDAWADEVNYKPWIWVGDSPDPIVSGNIADDVFIDKVKSPDGNLILSYTDPNSDTYAPDHIVNYDGGMVDLDDLSIRPDSPFYGGFGSSLTNSDDQDDTAENPPVEDDETPDVPETEPPVVVVDEPEEEPADEDIVNETPVEQPEEEVEEPDDEVVGRDGVEEDPPVEDDETPDVPETEPPVVVVDEPEEEPADEDIVSETPVEQPEEEVEEPDEEVVGRDGVEEDPPVEDDDTPDVPETEPPVVVVEEPEEEPTYEDIVDETPVEEPEDVKVDEDVAEKADDEPSVVEEPEEVAEPAPAFRSFKAWFIDKVQELKAALESLVRGKDRDDDTEEAAAPRSGWKMFGQWRTQKAAVVEDDVAEASEDTAEEEQTVAENTTGGRPQMWLKTLNTEVTLSEVVPTFEQKDEPPEDEEDTQENLFVA